LNLLFVTNDLYPYLNANSEIAYRIAKELVNHCSCKITIIGINRQYSKEYPQPDFAVKTIRIQSVTSYNCINEKETNRFKRLTKYCADASTLRYYTNCKINPDFALAKEYAIEIKRELRQNSYDCIIGFMAPKDVPMSLAMVKTNIPIILYKLDPWSTHYQNIGNAVEREREQTADKKANIIIATDLIKSDYETYADKATLSKLVTMEFPNIIHYPLENKFSEFNDDKIHCVFAGGLYKGIRDPKYTINLFEQLKNDNIVLHIVGYQSGGSLLPHPLPDNIVYHGQVSNTMAMKYMQSADILVNIGNTVMNQMPSKILTYISLGKPIVNIVKSPNCPTIPYLNIYPVALEIIEDNDSLSTAVKTAKDFIISNHCRVIPFEQISNLYPTCTPSYVANRLCKIINSIVN